MKLSRTLLLLLVAANAFAVWSEGHDDQTPQEAMAIQFNVAGILFGVPCVLFADRLGGAHGYIGHGNASPTPGPIVAGFGWLLLIVPFVIWAVR